MPDPAPHPARARSTILRGALLALTIAFVAACGDGGSTEVPVDPEAATRTPDEWAAVDAEYAELVDGYDEKTGARQMSVDDAMRRHGEGESIVFLDIREDYEVAVSRLPGAVRIDPDDVDDTTFRPPEGATVVTYCTAGYRSGFAAVALEERWGRPVHNLHGGIIAWFNGGGVVTDPGGSPVDRIHPFGEEWARFVHPRSSEDPAPTDEPDQTDEPDETE